MTKSHVASSTPVTDQTADQMTLENGLHVLCQHDLRMPFVALRLDLQAGARHDGSLPGLAHLCEHLACEGPTPAARSFAEAFYRVGGGTNGWTSHDHTGFADFVPAGQAATAFEIAAERLNGRGNWITDDDVRRHVNTILNEDQERSRSVPFASEIEGLQGLLYPLGDPYHWPAGGAPESLNRLTCDDAVEFFRHWYAPDRTVLTVVGDLNPDDLFREIESHLGAAHLDIPGPEPHRPPFPALNDASHELACANVPYIRHYLAYRLSGYTDASWTSGALFAKAVAVGRSSPLRRELVKQRVAHDVRVYIEPRRDATTVAFVATALPGVSRTQFETAFVQALDWVIAGQVRTVDIDRARKADAIARRIHSDKLVVRAEHLATATTLQHWYGVPDESNTLQSQSASSLLDEGCRMFTTAQRLRLSIVP